ncbi:hypothetical protein CDD81_1435 [Ophiocordyceps australis]|uniref:UAS domain-containing protein n=1 Tax=Ophiocordyceps australis TaxID=1399860 RepID=A0A2C5X821_9HYPO|nr:hypothetical protein CDD81_1435 [Ophiocordyceps australis]
MDDDISSFISITGVSADIAHGFLELTGGEFERAVGLYFENPELVQAPEQFSHDGSNREAASRSGNVASRSAQMGREDSSGVIHISDDEDMLDGQDFDDEDVELNARDGDASRNEDAAALHAANLAQEEEDAAMAKRLQEELYGAGETSGAGADDVRAPIARTTETLIAPDSWGPGGGGMDSDFLDQLARRRLENSAAHNGPFSQRIWADGSPPPAAENGTHARRLEDLFRPPYDLMCRASWNEARALGKEDKKWILVNLQDMNDFTCQALNRDIWKDQAVRELVSENFVFLQYDKDYPDSEQYMTLYLPNQGHRNADNFPHVSIVDPRTGEQVKAWSGRPFPSAADFHADLADFLDRYSLAAYSKNPVARAATRKPKQVDVERMTEEEMLEMALKNSLEGDQGSGAQTPSNIQDPDELTKCAGQSGDGQEASTRDKGKGKEVLVQSPFERIASNQPHTEPDNDAASTRIQFRHPAGRVIRRFKLQDPVQRIYEWLKAEPLEGKEGVEFELKKMPQGQDLIGALEATIESEGLKQATVMIEFID